MRPRGRLGSTITTGLAAVALVVAAGPPALAHNVVVDTEPAAEQRLAQPLEQVSVTFDDVVLDLSGGSTVLDVVGPGGMHHATGCPSVAGTSVAAPVALGRSGTYTVSWRIVSADGHPVSGSHTFEYAPSSDAAVSEGMPEPACARPEAAVETPADDPAPGVLVPLGVAAGTALAGGAAVLLALRLRTRKESDLPAR